MKRLMMLGLMLAAGLTIAHAQEKKNTFEKKEEKLLKKGEAKKDAVKDDVTGKKENEKPSDPLKDKKGKPEHHEHAGKDHHDHDKDHKDHKDHKEQGRDRKDHRDNNDEGKDHQDHKELNDHGKGHAYGRNKGDMSGHDFGKLRSAESRSKMRTQLDEMDKDIKSKESTAKENENKVIEAEKKINDEKASKKITEKVYEEKKIKVEEAKKKVTELKEIIEKKREEWKKMTEALTKAEQTPAEN